jgi:hypothetical protein
VNELHATLDPVRLLQQIRAAQEAARRYCGQARPRGNGETHLTDVGGISLRVTHGMAGGRGTPDQHSKAKAQAIATTAGSICGSDSQTAGMV